MKGIVGVMSQNDYKNLKTSLQFINYVTKGIAKNGVIEENINTEATVSNKEWCELRT